jgi:hypothetical protein
MQVKLTSLVAIIGALYIAGCGATSPTGSGGSGSGGSGAGGSGAGGTGGSTGDLDLGFPGRFAVQSYRSGWQDSPAYGAATIWYSPNAPTPWAGVAVVPGFTELQLTGWGSFLASHGFVTITIDTNSTGELPAARATALNAAINTLKAESSRSGSPLNGKMSSDSYAVMGHSMGGGGTLIASTDLQYKAAIPLAPWPAGSTHPSSRTPTLVITAENDSLVDDVGAENTYRSIGARPKAWMEFRGADHFVVNNPNSPGNAQIGGRYALAWLEIFLHSDARYKSVIQSNSAFSGFEVLGL